MLHVLPHTGDVGQMVTMLALCRRAIESLLRAATWTRCFCGTSGRGSCSHTGHRRQCIPSRDRLAAFPDGKRVLCCARSGLIVWHLDSNTQETLPMDEQVPLAEPGKNRPVPRHCCSVAFAADGSRFATTVTDASFAPRILVWDAKTCRVILVIPVRSGGSMAYAPDGSSLAALDNASNTEGNSVALWDATTGKKLVAGQVFDWALYDLAYTRDSKYLLLAGQHKEPFGSGKGRAGGRCLGPRYRQIRRAGAPAVSSSSAHRSFARQ